MSPETQGAVARSSGRLFPLLGPPGSLGGRTTVGVRPWGGRALTGGPQGAPTGGEPD